MVYNQRVSGHLVQGHVDTQAEVININKTDEWTEIDFLIESNGRKLWPITLEELKPFYKELY